MMGKLANCKIVSSFCDHFHYDFLTISFLKKKRKTLFLIRTSARACRQKNKILIFLLGFIIQHLYFYFFMSLVYTLTLMIFLLLLHICYNLLNTLLDQNNLILH